MRINSIEKWNEVSQKLLAHNYSLFQMQFSIDHPSGFHAWFTAHDMPQVEIVTRSEEIHDAILKYGNGKG